MKILVSDYDGTIKRFDKTLSPFELIDFKQDLKSIKEFMKKGNIFVISTKRMYESMIREIKKYDIEYDYLTIAEGLITFDKNNNLIYSNCIESEIIDFLKKEESKVSEKIKAIDCYDEKGKRSTFDRKNFTIVGITSFDTNYLARLQKFIYSEFKDIYVTYDFYSNTLWIHNNINKQIGIEKLMSIKEELSKYSQDIITVGDRINDYPMLINNNGYAIKDSSIADKFDKEQVVPNIRKLIKKIK